MARAGLPRTICLAVVVTALAVAAPRRCAAQTPSYPSQAGCTASLLRLAPCLSFAAGTSPAAPPSSACCSALASVVQRAPRCLCAVLRGGATAALGVTVNTTRALELPGQCSVQTPPVSECDAVGPPTAAPAGTASSPAPAPFVEAPTATPAGSASSPAPAPVVEAPSAPPPAAHRTAAAGAGSKQEHATPASGADSSHAGITKSASLVGAVALLMVF